MAEAKERVRTPLLDSYIKELSPYPEHMPPWINLAGWVVALVGILISVNFPKVDELGTVISILLGFITVHQLRQHYRGKTDRELSEEKAFKVVRRLKWAQNDSGIRKCLPSEVLVAMEEAVGIYNVAMARLAADDSFESRERIELLKRAMNACFLAVVPVLRGRDQGRKDWEAICKNRRLINEVLETISEQTLRMREPVALDPHRVAAWRELSQVAEDTSLEQR